MNTFSLVMVFHDLILLATGVLSGKVVFVSSDEDHTGVQQGRPSEELR